MRVVLLACVVIFSLCAEAASVVTPYQYPLFKQCDSRWGSEPIGTSTVNTICTVGCLMSSVSMALNGKNITIDGLDSNPDVLNKWLTANGGYVDTDDLEESIVPNIDPSKIAWVGSMWNGTALSPAEIKSTLDTKNTIVIYNVMKGQHFVLGTGYDETETNFYVNDPGFNTAYYLYSGILLQEMVKRYHGRTAFTLCAEATLFSPNSSDEAFCYV